MKDKKPMWVGVHIKGLSTDVKLCIGINQEDGHSVSWRMDLDEVWHNDNVDIIVKEGEDRVVFDANNNLLTEEFLEFKPLSFNELKEITKKCNDIKNEIYYNGRYNKFSGGFASAELDAFDDDYVYVKVKYGIKNDADDYTTTEIYTLFRYSLDLLEADDWDVIDKEDFMDRALAASDYSIGEIQDFVADEFESLHSFTYNLNKLDKYISNK